jgi:ribosome-associated toxin RatA of RatAB toxin-antitoxin module
MREVRRTVLVEYSPEQMYSLVEGVEDYPKFLPWCGGASVLHRDERTTRARIEINYHGVRHAFTTENRKQAPFEMHIRLVEGPFRRLDGSWRFVSLGGAGCRIEFDLVYEFSSRLLERLVGPVFNHIANTLVDAFLRRAEQVYGRKAAGREL